MSFMYRMRQDDTMPDVVCLQNQLHDIVQIRKEHDTD